MSEREAERRALIPHAASFPAQVQAAGRQLSVVSKLKQDMDRRSFVALLKRISNEDAVFFVEHYSSKQPWRVAAMLRKLPACG